MRIWTMETRVDSREVDMFNQARPSAVLGILQEAATQAALDLKVDGPLIAKKYNCLWMVTRNWVELYAPLHWDDHIRVETWHRGGSGASVYRDFDIFRDDKLMGQATTVWVMANIDTRKLFRMKDVEEFAGTDGGTRNKSIKLRRLELPATWDSVHSRYLGYSDTDLNGHINNIHYADYACDALHMEKADPLSFVQTFQIGYLSECRAGETLQMQCAAQGEDRFARGMGEDGTERFDFSLRFAPLP